MAENLPDWTKKTEVWIEKFDQEYVYATGTATYADNMSDVEFNKNWDAARAMAIGKIKTALKVDKLIGYQIIDQEYQPPTMYVLIAVPKALNKETPDITPEARIVNVENAAKSSDNLNIAVQTKIPGEWWKLYQGSQDPFKNVFRIGNYMFAIGHGIPDPKDKNKPALYWNNAKNSANHEAQKYLVAALNGIIGDIKGKKDYQYFVQGNLKNAIFLTKQGIENPYTQKEPPMVYCLWVVPLEIVKEIK
jgi:hypothetical protein